MLLPIAAIRCRHAVTILVGVLVLIVAAMMSPSRASAVGERPVAYLGGIEEIRDQSRWDGSNGGAAGFVCRRSLAFFGCISPSDRVPVSGRTLSDRGLGVTDTLDMAQAPALTVLLASDRVTYPLGATATFIIAVDNPSSIDASLAFPSAQVYDIAVFAGEAEVWRWSADRSFASVMRDRPFPPGVTLLERVTWDLRASDGALVQPGTYRAVGSLATSPPQLGNAVELTIDAR